MAITNRGVVFLSVGSKYAARLLVSISSLRAFHPTLPVTVMTNDDTSPWLRQLADGLRCDVLKIPLAPIKRNCCYLTKTMIHRQSPYEQYIFLDADTLVAGKLDELWPRDEKEIVWTTWCSWHTGGKMIGGRCRQFSEIAPDLVAAATKAPYQAAINNGVVGFNRSSPMLEEWHELAMKRPKFICDEVAAQLLHRHYPYRLLDDRWNRSGAFGLAPPESVHVWHFHGDKTFRDGPGREPWLAQAKYCVAKNVGGCNAWLKELLIPMEREAFAKAGAL